MIKLLKTYQIQITPFAATKNWNLNNTNNDNLLLFESTGSDDGLPFALEFIDYGDGSEVPVSNTACDIALEQQTDDLAISEIGLNVQGMVYPEIEPVNDDGTYKRSIYHQIETMFYNTYLDPSKIWGLEQIDFQISQTKRLLADEFRLIDVPRQVYGEKIIPKSVIIYDNTLDNSYEITDDGNGNLFAGINLFSHQQELGEYVNEFISDITSSYCDIYFNNIMPPAAPTNLSVTSGSAILNWTNNDINSPTFVIEKSIDGITYNQYATTSLTTLTDTTVTSSYQGSTYWYRVYAYNDYGNSNYTNIVNISFVIPIYGPNWNTMQWGGILNDYSGHGYASQSFSASTWSGSAYAGGNAGQLASCISSGSLTYSGPAASASIVFFNKSISDFQGFIITSNNVALVKSTASYNQSAQGIYNFVVPSGSNQSIIIHGEISYTNGTPFILCVNNESNSASFAIKNIPI